MLESGEVTLDKLQKIQEEVVSAFPEVLRIGHFLENCSAAHIYSLRDEIIAMVGTKFDSRLATHYAFNLACALKVCFIPPAVISALTLSPGSIPSFSK